MAIYIGDKNITEVAAGNALESAKQYADQGDALTLTQAKTYTNEREESIRTDYEEADATTLKSAQAYADNNKVDKTDIGVAGGVAELDDNGLILSSQLPSYVDDVLEYDSQGSFPASGEAGKIYVAKDINLTYRWSGSGYVEISPSLALGETSSTAYRGDRGKTAYDHSQIKSGNPHGTTFTSLPDKPNALPANGGNADTVDGLHSYDFARRGEFKAGSNLNDINGFGFFQTSSNSTATSENNYPIDEAGILIYGNAAYNSACQIYGSYNSNRWFVRGGGTSTGKTSWAEIWTTRNLTKLSQLQDDVVSGNYFKLSANRVTNLNDTPINSFFVSSLGPSNSPVSYAEFVNGFCFASDNNSSYKRQLVYADDWYGRTQNVGTWGGWNKFWHSGNLTPVTIDSDQIITGWKRFNPSARNGVFNTTGIIDNKDTYATPLSWTAKTDGSIWNIQQESDSITLIGIQGGKAIKLLSNPSQSQVIADRFNGTASNILDRSNNSSKSIWTGTQAEYDAISTKDSNTIYFIV